MKLVDLIGTNKLNNAVELYYVCLLGKYLKEKNITLSLKDADLSEFEETLHHSTYLEYIAYSIENNFILDVNLDLEYILEDEEIFSKLSVYFFMESFSVTKPFFYNIEGYKYYIDMNDTKGDHVNLSLFRETNVESAIIDLVAYLHIEGFFKDIQYELYPALSNVVRSSPMGVSSMFYIANSKISNNVLQFELRKGEANNLRYSTWYFLGKEQGLLSDEGYTITDKLEAIKKSNYQVGSVVNLNYRKSTSQERSKDKLKSCVLAIITDISDTHITLKKVPTTHTRASRRQELESYSQSVQALYDHTDLEITPTKETFSLLSIGIDYVMSDSKEDFEKYFITSISEGSQVNLLVEQNGLEFELMMGVVDAVFWILKDWGMSFNENLFIESNYKKGEIPLYYQESYEEEFSFDF